MKNFEQPHFLSGKAGWLVPCLALFLLSGCSALKTGVSGAGTRYYESFYVGAEGNQYFVKPISFRDLLKKETLEVDLTFRYKRVLQDSAIINLSLKGPVVYKAVDTLIIANPNSSARIGSLDLLFNERTRAGFTSRFTAKIPLTELKNMFILPEWTFTVHQGGQQSVFRATKKTRKALSAIRDHIFVFM